MRSDDRWKNGILSRVTSMFIRSMNSPALQYMCLPTLQLLHQMTQGVEVLIISLGVFHALEAKMFLRSISEENLSSNCTVVLRAPLTTEGQQYDYLLKSSEWLKELRVNMSSKRSTRKLGKKKKNQTAQKQSQTGTATCTCTCWN